MMFLAAYAPPRVLRFTRFRRVRLTRGQFRRLSSAAVTAASSASSTCTTAWCTTTSCTTTSGTAGLVRRRLERRRLGHPPARAPPVALLFLLRESARVGITQTVAARDNGITTERAATSCAPVKIRATRVKSVAFWHDCTSHGHAQLIKSTHSIAIGAWAAAVAWAAVAWAAVAWAVAAAVAPRKGTGMGCRKALNLAPFTRLHCAFFERRGTWESQGMSAMMGETRIRDRSTPARLQCA